MRALSFDRTIGAGAFGTVYRAELRSGQGFRRTVAVKVIQARGPEGAMFLSRMRDEARLLGLLQDDAILKVLDMVQVDGRDAVVMEYIEGVDLDSLIDGSRPSPRALAELGATMAGALHRAHTARHPREGSPLNVVHRDVKPANVMVTRSGGVRLLDFGVARARFEARESQTGQLVLGTLNYMAPEYIVTGDISPAADVFALGLTLYEAATGEVFGQPKVRRDSHERRLAERMQTLEQLAPELAGVVRRFLAWDPTTRPDGAEAETLLWDVAGQLRGGGLRQWAARSVPAALAARGATEDPFGLVGRSFELDEAAPDMPVAQQEAQEDAPDRAQAPAPTGAPLPPDPTSPVAQPAPAAAAPRSPQGRESQGRESQGRQSQGRESQGRESQGRAGQGPTEPPTAQTARPAPRPPATPQARPASPPARPTARSGGSGNLRTVIVGAAIGLVVGVVTLAALAGIFILLEQ